MEEQFSTIYFSRSGRTYNTTGSTKRTPIFIKHNLRRSLNRFRIMTPEAAKRTALKKYGCTYTGSIIYRKMLNIENHYIFGQYFPQHFKKLQFIP
jgi:hypothetical protein